MRFTLIPLLFIALTGCNIKNPHNSNKNHNSAISQSGKIKPNPEYKKQLSYVTPEKLISFAPNIRPEWLIALSQPKLYVQYDITTVRQLSHFMAQIAHESAGFTRIDENLNYSAKALHRVFGSRVSPEVAQRLHRKPRLIANYVYGNRLGNLGRNTQDGWKYRGSGFIQLTGRDNFVKFGKIIGEDIATFPDRARQPDIGLKTALAFWKANNLNDYADANDFCRIRRKINGGLNGVDESMQWYQRAVAVFDLDPKSLPDPDGIDGAQDIPRILDILGERGILVNRVGSLAEKLEYSLKLYQEQRGLLQTGILDIATLTALSDHRDHDLAIDHC